MEGRHRHKLQNLYANNLAGFSEDKAQEKYLLGDPTGEPYAVFISGTGVILVNVVIFAQSEEDAKERILKGVRDVLKKNNQYTVDRARRILELADEFGVQVEKVNKGFVLSAPWAGNDYLV